MRERLYQARRRIRSAVEGIPPLEWIALAGLSALLALILLPIYCLGYSVGAWAIGIGRGAEAWWADVKRYWKEMKL